MFKEIIVIVYSSRLCFLPWIWEFNCSCCLMDIKWKKQSKNIILKCQYDYVHVCRRLSSTTASTGQVFQWEYVIRHGRSWMFSPKPLKLHIPYLSLFLLLCHQHYPISFLHVIIFCFVPPSWKVFCFSCSVHQIFSRKKAVVVAYILNYVILRLSCFSVWFLW